MIVTRAGRFGEVTDVRCKLLRTSSWLESELVPELCESQSGRPWLPVPRSPCGVCGRKETLNLKHYLVKAQELCESRGGRSGLPVPNSPSVEVKKHRT